MPSNDIRELSAHGLQVWKTEGGRKMDEAHLHQDLEFNFLVRGTMRYLIGGAFVMVPEQRLCVIWGAMPHQVVVSQRDQVMILATLPLAQAMLWNLPGEFLRRLLRSGIVVDPEPNASDLPLLQQWQRDLQKNEAPRRQLVLDEIAARLHRMALNLADAASEGAQQSTPDAPSGDTLLQTQKMAALISEKFREPLTTSDIARHVNLHPNYAMTLFRRQTGITLNAYLTRQRVAHAQRLLAMSSLPILDIAQECGFRSVSRFYEAFKAESACTPSQFRRRLAPP